MLGYTRMVVSSLYLSHVVEHLLTCKKTAVQEGVFCQQLYELGRHAQGYL